MTRLCLLFLQHDNIEKDIRKESTRDKLINPLYDFRPFEIIRKYCSKIEECQDLDLDSRVAVSYILALLKNMKGDIHGSLILFEDILAFLQDHGPSYTIEYCQLEISLDEIVTTITDIVSRIDLENVKRIFDNGDFNQVVTTLSKVFSDMTNQIHDACNVEKRLTLLTLLKESHRSVGNFEDAWICVVMYFNIYALQVNRQDLKWEDWFSKVFILNDNY